MASSKVNRETEFAVVPLAGTCWCSGMSFAFTAQLGLAPLALFIAVGGVGLEIMEEIMEQRTSSPL